MKKDTTTREKILKAAMEVFLQKGKDGARMQEIADRASVNKAMLFYYFTSKDVLFREVFRSHMKEIINNIKSIFISETDPEKKIEQLIHTYLQFFQNNPALPKLMLRESSNDSNEIREIIRDIKQEYGADIPDKFISLIKDSIGSGHFYDVDPRHTIISIIGMTIIYFIGRPIIETLLELENVDNYTFLLQREENILFLLKNGLLKKEPS